MANWSLPTLATLYSDFLTQSKERDEDAIKMLDGTTSTNLPSGAKRWNATGNKFEKWNGTAWSDLATLYEIKVRDSDRLNGQAASYYATSGHGHTAATTSAAGFMSSTDKSKLDAIASNANNYSHPTGDGNLHVPANGTANSGKFLQATGVAGSYVWANAPTTSLSTLGISATADELNILDGATVTTVELNYLDGVASSVQTQLDGKAANNQTMYLGTTAVAINRASAALTLVGVNIDGNASTATTANSASSITSAVAGSAIAGIAASAIGSYMFGTIGSTGTLAFGATIAGSSIKPTSTNITAIDTARSGTWRCMGHITDNGATVGTLFLRIA